MSQSLSGNIFGNWLVLERDYEYAKQFSHTSVYWKCKCLKCERVFSIRQEALTSGRSTQCKICSRLRTGKDETGKKYGKLIVIEQRPSKKKRIMWLCKCICGNFIEVSGTDLRTSKVQSCGKCPDRISNGEYQVLTLLKQNDIKYIQEYTFDNFTYKTGQHPRFDFAIFENDKLSYLIEVDGRQHFSYCDSGWDTKENFEDTIEKDKIKNDYCKSNNIPLIRIPYHRLPKLILEDLLITSNYKI